jgi:hypothetical protein
VRLRRGGLYHLYASFGGDGANGPARTKLYRVSVPLR